MQPPFTGENKQKTIDAVPVFRIAAQLTRVFHLLTDSTVNARTLLLYDIIFMRTFASQILRARPVLPQYLSQEARLFIKQLLRKETEQRLGGGPADVEDVKVLPQLQLSSTLSPCIDTRVQCSILYCLHYIPHESHSCFRAVCCAGAPILLDSPHQLG